MGFKEFLNEQSAHNKEADAYGSYLSNKNREETEERLKNAKAVKLDLGKFKLDYSNSERVSGIIDDKKDVMIWYEYKNERAIKGYRINNKEVNGDKGLSDNDIEYFLSLKFGKK